MKYKEEGRTYEKEGGKEGRGRKNRVKEGIFVRGGARKWKGGKEPQ